MSDAERAIKALKDERVRRVAEEVLQEIYERHRGTELAPYVHQLRMYVWEASVEDARRELLQMVKAPEEEADYRDAERGTERFAEAALIHLTKEFAGSLAKALAARGIAGFGEPPLRPSGSERSGITDEIQPAEGTQRGGGDGGATSEAPSTRALGSASEAGASVSQAGYTSLRVDHAEEQTPPPAVELLSRLEAAERERDAALQLVSKQEREMEQLREQLRALEQELRNAKLQIERYESTIRSLQESNSRLSLYVSHLLGGRKGQRIRSCLALLRALKDRGGVARVYELRDALGWKRARVNRNLIPLMRAGLVSRRGTGMYELTEVAARADTEDDLLRMLLSRLEAAGLL